MIAVSAAVKEHLISRGFPQQNITVIFPGARDCSLPDDKNTDRERMRAQLDLKNQEQAVFLIGRVAEVKGHDIALEALRFLQLDGSTNIRMFFTGQETSWGTAVRNSTLGTHATWLGHRDDIPQLLAAADICIQPSRSEGLGIALMEAASAGKALIATEVGGIPEIIEHNRSGLLIPPENPQALFKAIRQLTQNPDQASRLGQQARQRFKAEFAIDTMVKSTIDFYKKQTEFINQPIAF